MRVTIIINKFSIGGAERLVLDEIKILKEREIDVSVITLRPETKESFFNELHDLSVTTHQIYCSSIFDVFGYLRLWALLIRERPDRVYTHLWFANTIGRIAAAAAFIPTRISFEHNVYDTIKTPFQFLVDVILQYLSTHIVAVSNAVKNSLVNKGIHKNKVCVIQNGIDSRRLALVQSASIRSEPNLSEDAFVFCHVGRLVAQKGVDVLIEAFSALPNKPILLVVGDGQEREALEALCLRLQVNDRVLFLGVRKDVSAILQDADCFVLASRFEGQGIVLFEALFSQIPIIATALPAIEEVIQGTFDCCIVSPENALALTEAMQVQLQKGRRRAAYPEELIKRLRIETHVDEILKIT